MGAMGISIKAYAELQARLRRPSGSADPAVAGPVDRTPGLALGVDPSLRGTGYGLVAREGSGLRAVDYGTIACPRAWSRTECLRAIARRLREIVEVHRPTVVILEGLFHARNVRTALVMGEARGAALAVLAEFGLEIYEIAPRRVKLAITGHGAAAKLAVARMVQRMLSLPETPAPDAADALALAVAHWQTQGRPWAASGERRL